VSAHLEPGAMVITGAWQDYSGINALGDVRDAGRPARALGED